MKENQPEHKPQAASPEAMVRAYLSYQDAPLPAEIKQKTLQGTMSDASAQKYARALLEAPDVHSLREIEQSARRMEQQCSAQLGRLGISGTPYAQSISWAMWDIAKQLYFLARPGEADEKYRLADPLVDAEKFREIVDRHVGWEAYAAYNDSNEKEFLESVADPALREKISSYLSKSPKDNGTLSSKELAELGALLRDA